MGNALAWRIEIYAMTFLQAIIKLHVSLEQILVSNPWAAQKCEELGIASDTPAGVAWSLVCAKDGTSHRSVDLFVALESPHPCHTRPPPFPPFLPPRSHVLQPTRSCRLVFVLVLQEVRRALRQEASGAPLRAALPPANPTHTTTSLLRPQALPAAPMTAARRRRRR